MSAQKPIAWSIAGSDSGAGAGLQADLRAFEAFGLHGCTAVAALTAQNSRSVNAVEAVAPTMLRAQLDALAADMRPAVIKTGLLGSAANMREVVREVDALRRAGDVALVVDPVLGATTGKAFADEAMLDAYRRELLPRATLITPNRTEAAALLGLMPLETEIEVEQAARALLDMGAGSVVITGGDGHDPSSGDYIATSQARGWLRLARIATPHHHGTGCVFAASAAAALALGFVEAEACVLAKMSTAEALRNAFAAGGGAGPVRPREGFAMRIGNLPGLTPAGESQALPPFAPLDQPRMGLYAIVDSAGWVERALVAGVRTVQLRIKDPASGTLASQIRQAVECARRFDAQLFINDHWQLAIEAGAYGVHLGQEDLLAADLRAIARAGLRLGVSTHACWEVCRAWRLGPSYIACGPVHPTKAKAMPWIPQGNDNLAYWCSLLPVPVVAIGGMDAARAAEAIGCGAQGVAVIGNITQAASPEEAIRELQDAIASATPQRHVGAFPRPTLDRVRA